MSVVGRDGTGGGEPGEKDAQADSTHWRHNSDLINLRELERVTSASVAPPASSIVPAPIDAVLEADRTLTHAITIWEDRLREAKGRQQRRSLFEKLLVCCMVVLAGLVTNPTLFGDISRTIVQTLTAGIAVGGILSAVLLVLNPFAVHDQYALRLERMIALGTSFKQQLTTGPSVQQFRHISQLACFAHELLRPHRSDW